MPHEDTVAAIRKNSREEIRVGLQEYRGVDLATIRIWFAAADGSMRPGKDGLNFRVELLPEIADALNALVEQARVRGLVQG